jgi:hypothetical protein
MNDKVTPERIARMAAAARVTLPENSPARIAKAIAPIVARMDAENIQLPLEIEPATFVVIARKGAKP